MKHDETISLSKNEMKDLAIFINQHTNCEGVHIHYDFDDFSPIGTKVTAECSCGVEKDITNYYDW